MPRRMWVGSLGVVLLLIAAPAMAANGGAISFSINTGGGNTEVATAMKIFLFMTLLSLAPALILTMTSFTRIVVVLSFLRQAIGVHQSPPNQVVVGLALFLTIFLMSPVLKEVHAEALTPLIEEKIDYQEALTRASKPLKGFMLRQTSQSDLGLLLSIAHQEPPETPEALPMSVMIPAFVLSELKTAFQIGFLIYLPFVLIDMVVAMVLLTMGMMVLPPVIISLPFKLMLFVLVDGWNLVVGSLVRSFA